MPSLQLGGAPVSTGWCQPLRHPSHPRARGRRAAEHQALAQGTETAYEDQYFRTTPRLETGDERYAWVNQTVFVGQGRIYPGSSVQYRVYRVN